MTSFAYFLSKTKFNNFKIRIFLSDRKLTSKALNLTDINLILIATILLLISAFRADHIGADHLNYLRELHRIELFGDTYFSKNGEIGYVFFNRLILLFSNSHWFFNGIVSAMLVIPFLQYVEKYTDKNYQAFAMFIFVCQPYFYLQNTFNIMRQCCATGVVLLAFDYLHSKKVIRYSILVIIASTFHRSLLLMIFLPLLYYINWTQRKWITAATVALLINYLKMGKIIISAVQYIGVFSRYSRFKFYEPSMLNFKPYVFFIYCYVIFLTYFYRKFCDNQEDVFWINMYLLSLVFLIFAVQNEGLYRIYISVSLFSINGSVILIKKMKRNIPAIELVYVGYYSCFYIGYITLLYFRHNTQYVPFQFLFDI